MNKSSYKIGYRYWVRTLVIAAATTMIGCSRHGEPAAPTLIETAPLVATGEEQQVETTSIRETTQVELAGHLVGVGNIFEDEEEDAQDGSSAVLRATLSIQDRASGREWHERVAEGETVSLGAARFRVEEIEEGETGPGRLVMRWVH